MGQNRIRTLSEQPRLSRATITIPGNAAYAQYDVLGPTGPAAILFDGVAALPGDGGQIVEALLEFQTTAVVAGMGTFRLWLFNAAHAGIADNDPMALAAGSLSAAVGLQGYLEFAVPEDFGSTLVSQGSASSTTFVSTTPKAFVCGSTTSLWGVLETRAAISGTVPASMVCNIQLTIQPVQ